jgi:hypothetical protein
MARENRDWATGGFLAPCRTSAISGNWFYRHLDAATLHISTASEIMRGSTYVSNVKVGTRKISTVVLPDSDGGSEEATHQHLADYRMPAEQIFAYASTDPRSFACRTGVATLRVRRAPIRFLGNCFLMESADKGISSPIDAAGRTILNRICTGLSLRPHLMAIHAR